MHSRIEQPAMDAPALTSDAPNEVARMKYSSEYGNIVLDTENEYEGIAINTPGNDHNREEKISEVFVYNNYDIEDRYSMPGASDPNLSKMKKILEKEKGTIREVILVSYCYIDGKPETNVPLSPEEKNELASKYKFIMRKEGVSYSGASFNVTAKSVSTAQENDGGCMITAQFKYTC